MGPRLHHAGFDCGQLGEPLKTLDQRLSEVGMPSLEGQQNGVFTVSSLLDHRFYPTTPQKTVFANGDEHRLCLGGLALAKSTLKIITSVLPIYCYPTIRAVKWPETLAVMALASHCAVYLTL